jgi:hypothetical protein
MRCLYPLSAFVASFDFVHWMLRNRANGMRHVVFDARNPKTSKWPAETILRRMQSIMVPAAMIGGMTVSIGTDGEKTEPPYFTGFIRWCREGGKFDLLKSPIEPLVRSAYTITLRKTQRSPERDSDEAVWREFAGIIGARVIEDVDTQTMPLSLVERIAVASGAKMNYGVCNGPMFMLAVSEYPTAMFAANDSWNMHRKAKLEPGEQFPWSVQGKHFMIEERPTVKSLLEFHEKWAA